MKRLKVAWRLWCNKPTRQTAWPYLLGRQKLVDWEVDLLLKPRRKRA